MRKNYIALAALLAALAVACGKKAEKVLETGNAAAGDKGYTYAVTVEKMQFHWRLDGGLLRVKLKAPVQGWLAAGFDPERGMLGSNMMVGYLEGGRAVVTDQHGTDPKLHRKDIDLGGTDDLRETWGRQDAAGTEIGFTLPLETGDKLDKPLRPEAVVLMLAYGTTNEMAKQHVFWGKARLNLRTGAYETTIIKREE